jgi:hypothetical protein
MYNFVEKSKFAYFSKTIYALKSMCTFKTIVAETKKNMYQKRTR